MYVRASACMRACVCMYLCVCARARLCCKVFMRPEEGQVHWPSSPIRNVGAADMLDEE